MFLDYSKLAFDKNGAPETPELLLQTLDGSPIGVLSGVAKLKLNIKFSEPSEISFEVPKETDGVPTPLYSSITGHKLIYTKNYGVYVIMNPETSSDGVLGVKSVRGFSLEKTLDSKRFFVEEGTFNFWDGGATSNTRDTVVGRILEIATGWKVGYVSSSLIGRYRTFDQYDDYLLSFIYGAAQEKFRCVFVFDPYAMTINAYDADLERPTLPIYLDFDNLVTHLDVNEVSDELVTAIRPYGADGLDIRSVNPIGTNWIYDLSYFVANGDIPDTLAQKWNTWQKVILARMDEYRALTELRALSTAKLLAERAALTDLQGELQDLINQQSVTIQALSMETTSTGKETQQRKLDEINTLINKKKAEITSKEDSIKGIEADLVSSDPSTCNGKIQAIVRELSIDTYFSNDERLTLSKFFIERDITEESFVATDVDTSVSGATYPLSGNAIHVTSSNICKVDFTSDFKKRMFTLSGGSVSISSKPSISGDIIRSTLELSDDGSCVMSICVGALSVDGKKSESGMLTVSGRYGAFTTDISDVTEDGVTVQKGSLLNLDIQTGSLYLTANVSEYQKYSVQTELFKHAASILGELATPTYEFSVDSANFIFANEFSPFRNSLRLGDAVYLRIDDQTVITPIIIEFELDFEDRARFSLVFSNRFKRHDNVNTLKDMIEASYSSGREFDASKYIYNQTSKNASAVSKFMNDALDAAKNSIIGAKNQTVRIDGAGIHIGGDSNHQMRIINSMIALTDDRWQTAKMAIGLFATPDAGTYFGVNAEVIGGKLIVGNNLVIENQTDTGVMQFKVDATGAWLNNATFLLQNDLGGKLMLDPVYGVAAGSSMIYDTNGTTVTPSFIDGAGNLIFDKENFPTGVNFYLDPKSGNAYFRGTVHATDGVFNGTVYATDGKFSGEIEATKGTFSGTIKAATLDGKLVGGTNGGILEGIGINVGDGAFVVDRTGNLTLKGSITWGKDTFPVKSQFAVSASGPWHDVQAANDIYRRDVLYDGSWGPPYQFVGKDGRPGSDGSDADVNWKNIKKALSSASALSESIITIDSVGAPNIYGGNIYGGNFYAGTGTNSFASMQGDGFYLYHDDADVPKAILCTAGNGGTISLILGSGSGSSDGIANRFYIIKDPLSATMFFTGIGMKQCGFHFSNDGVITPIGELDVAARFG